MRRQIEPDSRLRTLAQRIKVEDIAARDAQRRAVLHAIEAGKLLMEAKQHVAHGQWLPWLQRHCQMSERTAQGYMRVARKWPTLDEQKRNGVADLSLRAALKALAGPVADGEFELRSERLVSSAAPAPAARATKIAVVDAVLQFFIHDVSRISAEDAEATRESLLALREAVNAAINRGDSTVPVETLRSEFLDERTGHHAA